MVSGVAKPDSPAITSAASPGASLRSRKLRTTMASIVGTACRAVRRRARSSLMGSAIGRSGSSPDRAGPRPPSSHRHRAEGASQPSRKGLRVPAGFIDRARAARLMAAEGLDALLLLQPETLRWAAGAEPGVAASWRRAGAAMLLVPADLGEPLAAVVGDLQAANFQAASGIEDVRTHPIWVDTASLSRTDLTGAALRAALAGPAAPRPSTFARDLALRALADILAGRGLARARIGTEHAFLPVADARAFAEALPGVVWSDASPLVARLRMIKHPTEALWLDWAARAAEAGLERSRRRCGQAWTRARSRRPSTRRRPTPPVASDAPEPFGTWAYIAVGTDGFTPGGPARPGDVVKVDVGCTVRGYSSDGARTFVLGEPSPAAAEVHAVLLRAFEAGLEALRPGTRFAEVYRKTLACVRRGRLHELRPRPFRPRPRRERLERRVALHRGGRERRRRARHGACLRGALVHPRPRRLHHRGPGRGHRSPASRSPGASPAASRACLPEAGRSARASSGSTRADCRLRRFGLALSVPCHSRPFRHSSCADDFPRRPGHGGGIAADPDRPAQT